MIFLKKGLGAVCTLGLVCVLSRPALAQSVLNFPARNVSRIAVTNTTPYIADVKFTLYTKDGSQAATALNPVSRRIPPKGQISVAPSDLFRMEGARTDTWIQASSPVNGLEGIQFSPDFNSAGGDAFDAYPVQTIPYIPSDLRTPSTLHLTNPGSQTANFTLTFFTREGIQLSSSPSSLPAHAQLVVTTPPRAVSARVRADTAIIAVAAGTSGNTPVLVRGRSARAQARVLVAPYFKDKDNNAQLILTNSNNADAEATVTFFTDGGAYAIPPIRVSLKANGTASVPGPPEGWVLVESPGAPISGIVLVASGNMQAAIPLQVAPSERMLFSRSPGSTTEPTFNLIGTREPAIVTVTLNRPDGTTIAKRDFTISPLHRFSEKLSDIISVSDSSSIGYLTVQSTSPVYGLEVTNGDSGSILSGTSPQELGQGFQSSAAVSAPRITSIDGLPPGPDGVKRITIAGQNFDDSATLSIGGRVVPMIATATNGRFTAELPELEPGFVNVKVRVGGLESKVFALLVAPENGEFFLRSGRAMYQKTEVLESGLDPNRTAAVPIRGARVEVWDPFTQRPVSVSETDEDGAFRLVVADRPGLRVRVQSRLRSSEVRVLDNPVGGQLYALTADAGDARDTAVLEMMDTTRQAGAFNILDNVQRANMLLALSDSQMTPPPLTIYWSERNAGGAIKATFFNPDTNTAHVLGDRNTDSDEFDDSVILHEYAHMLAVRFSRDESPGGPHFIGDILDPRLAWSEGWANFFSCAARGTPIYLDSKGPGVLPFRYDLEDDIPPNDRPGYYSEASVGGLLWDLLDESQDNVDSARFSFAAIWAAFVDLRNVRYMYLPYFLESFLEKNPGFSDALRAMVIRRGGINFQPDARPSVVEPFPRPIAVGVGVSGAELDSYSYKRTNLTFSTHFYSFSTATGGSATITLTIETLGAANNPNANDLDLYLYDANGKRLDLAARVGNGQPETIAGARLSPGTYYIEVRSYSLRPDNTIVFNSGRYRLGLQLR